MIDFSKIKNNKVVKWGLIIALPTILVAGYYGYKYIKNKNTLKSKDELGGVDLTGMDYFNIKFPFDSNLVQDVYKKIKDINYSPVGSIVIDNGNNNLVAVLEIMALPKEYEVIKSLLKEMNDKITVNKISKDDIISVSKEVIELIDKNKG